MTAKTDYADRIAKRNAEVVRLVEECGKTRLEAAKLAGVSSALVGGILKEARRNRVVEVPAWVPSRLAEYYRQIARESGEESAASYCRRAKREAVLHAGPCEHGAR